MGSRRRGPPSEGDLDLCPFPFLLSCRLPTGSLIVRPVCSRATNSSRSSDCLHPLHPAAAETCPATTTTKTQWHKARAAYIEGRRRGRRADWGHMREDRDRCTTTGSDLWRAASGKSSPSPQVTLHFLERLVSCHFGNNKVQRNNRPATRTDEARSPNSRV